MNAMNAARTEDPPEYRTQKEEDDEVIRQAMEILAHRVRSGPIMTGPGSVRDYLVTWLAGRDTEAFAVLFVDSARRLITAEVVSEGTLGLVAVHSREILKRVLALNASAVVLAHNHPSGSLEFSGADIDITDRLRGALALIDVQVLDHVLVSVAGSTSMRERGLMT